MHAIVKEIELNYKGERRWNIANNIKYRKAISNDEVPYTYEKLSLADQQNKYVMTSLRMMWGLDTEKIEKVYREELRQELDKKIQQGYLKLENDRYVLTREGKHSADFVSMELLV